MSGFPVPSGTYVPVDAGEYLVGAPSGGDDTSTINTLIASGISAGNTKIILRFQSGKTYLINGSLVTTSNRNAQIPLPAVAITAPKVTIVFGLVESSGQAPTAYGNQTSPQAGTVLLSNLNVGVFSSATGVASVIGGPAYGNATLANTAQNQFTNLRVIFDGITVRQQSNPTAVSVDLSHVAQGGGKLVTDTNVGYSTIAACTSPMACGVIMPQSYNNAWCPLELWTSGYYCGWVPGEHTTAVRVTQVYNVIGMGAQVMSHSAQIDYLSSEANQHHIAGWNLTSGVVDCGSGQNDNATLLPTSGFGPFLNIGLLDLEDDSAPFATVDHIKDASNLLRMRTTYSNFPTANALIVTGTGKCSLINLETLTGVWQTPTLLNSWVAVAGFNPPQYRKTPDGLVILQLAIQSGTLSQALTLPAGFRPSVAVDTPIVTVLSGTNGIGFVNIQTNGSVNVNTISAGVPTSCYFTVSFWADA